MSFYGPHPVDGRIADDPVHPACKLLGLFIAVYLLPHLYKTFLHHIAGVLFIAQHPECQPEGPVPEFLHQLPECFFIAVLHGADYFVQGLLH